MFDISTITGYVQANEKELLGKAIIGAKTASMLNLQVGVRGSAYLNLLDSTATLQAGACGWNAAGTDTLSVYCLPDRQAFEKFKLFGAVRIVKALTKDV